jgi:adenylate kinase
MARIVITGTPGTGKTQTSRLLAKNMGLPLVEIKEFVDRNRIFKKEKGEKVVDVRKLGKKLLPHLARIARTGKRNGYIVEGHLACELRIPADFVFVLRTHPKTLRKRLAKRRYKKAKLEDNLLSEMLDYCVQRTALVYKITPLELDTTGRTAGECAQIIKKAAKAKKKKLDAPDYSSELESFLRLSP